MRVHGVMGWVLGLGAVCWLRLRWVLVGLAFVPGVAWATANPANVGTTMGRLVDSKAAALGFGSTDPRVAATRSAISAEAHSLLEDVIANTELSTISSATESALASTAAATSWAAAGLFAGVGALMGGLPQPLADGSVDQWTVNSDGSVTISGNPHVVGGSVSPFPPLVVGGSAWCVYQVCGSSAQAAAQAYAQDANAGGAAYDWVVDSCTAVTSASASCTFDLEDKSTGVVESTTSIGPGLSGSAWSQSACSSGMWHDSGCMAYVAPPPTPVETQTLPLDQAIADLPASDEDMPVGSPWMADLTDSLWQQAASQAGYQGLPYPSDSPISSSDVGSIQSLDPSSYPTVGDLVAPGADGSSTGSQTGSTSSPYGVSDPSAASTPAATNPGSGPEANLGPDPGIGLPTLESIPTAAQILAPLLNLLPDFRSYAVPAHTGTCPQPSFTWAGTTYTWTKHCELIEQNRSLIYGAFVVVFSLAAALIVLTA